MRLDALMDEVAETLRQITGLRVFGYPPDSLTPPAGVVSYPESIDFDQTYGRGADRVAGLPIILVVGKATDRAAREAVAAWASGSGESSVKAALEAWSWTSCDELTVTRCAFDVVTIAGTDYLAAMFEADAIGRGEE